MLYGTVQEASYRVELIKPHRASTFLDIYVVEAGWKEYLVGWADNWMPDISMGYLTRILPSNRYKRQTPFSRLLWYWEYHCSFRWVDYNDREHGIYYPVPVLMGRTI